MTRSEIMGILTILKATYPNFYKQMSQDEIKDIVNVWAMMFESDNAKIVTEAVKAMIITLKFPPTIADVKEKIRLITAPERMTEIEAWNLVYKAISNANYGAQEEFDKLPPTLQRLVGSPNQLREWAAMDGETVKSVIQSNFMRSYTARVKSEEQRDFLPESTKQLIAELSTKFTMIGDGG